MIERMNGLCRHQRRGGWLLGCGIALAVVVAILIGVGVYIAMNARSWTASAMDQGFSQLIADAPIDDREKLETQAVWDEFVARFRDKKVSFAQLGEVFTQVAQSPVLPAGIAMGVGESYFGKSSLTDEQKADGKKQVARIAEGIASEQIDPSVLREVLAPLRAGPTEKDVVQFELKGTQMRVKVPKNVTDDELLAFIESARKVADENSLPEEPAPFDLSSELQKAIDTALTGGSDETPDESAIQVPADGGEPGGTPADGGAPEPKP